ncbi:MAG: tyrosine-protein phosphatase [Lachnospiraceae bacterium]|nr:tyrosine-protein phosphatase [Lachnospiraceae bacterium]
MKLVIAEKPSVAQSIAKVTIIDLRNENIVKISPNAFENDNAIFNIFHTMANSEGGILFHCQEGKDRTGVISALLMLLGNVADVDIIADYEISNAYLYEMTKVAKTIPNAVPDYLLYIKSEYMAFGVARDIK